MKQFRFTFPNSQKDERKRKKKLLQDSITIAI